MFLLFVTHLKATLITARGLVVLSCFVLSHSVSLIFVCVCVYEY